MQIRFVLAGEPRGKGRHRHTRNGRTYTDKKTLDYEADCARACKSVMAGTKPLEGPVYLMVYAYLKIPKSASKARRAAMLSGAERPTKKPDFDNIGKIVSDALNGIAYIDDAQVVGAGQFKFWSDHPRIEVVFGPVQGGSRDGNASDGSRRAKMA